MSSKEIACARGPQLPLWGPLNTDPRPNGLRVSRKSKKSTKRKFNLTKRNNDECVEINIPVKKRKGSSTLAMATCQDVVATSTDVPSRSTISQPDAVDQLPIVIETRVLPLTECWEVDSGFASEASSPPSSGRCSPCIDVCRDQVVAMDCEMVGTGPEGQRSELARCSILGYDGKVLYDQYILPLRPVTNFRTRWSGIRKEHLQNAVPFKDARDEILRLLQDKVVVGHAIHNDFKALKYSHPWHMVRDTITCRALRHMNDPSSKHGHSLKTLSRKLLNRDIQMGRSGHCSVEDALAALDLYKLVEECWERELADKEKRRARTRSDLAHPEPPLSDYMLDQYWPEDMDCSQ